MRHSRQGSMAHSTKQLDSPARKIPRDPHEDARDVARRKTNTKAFLKSTGIDTQALPERSAFTLCRMPCSSPRVDAARAIVDEQRWSVSCRQHLLRGSRVTGLLRTARS